RAAEPGRTRAPAHRRRAGTHGHARRGRAHPRHRRLDPVPQAQGAGPVSRGISRRGGIYGGLLALAAAAMLVSSVLSLRTTDRVASAVAEASRTQRVIERINRLWGLLGDRDSE